MENKWINRRPNLWFNPFRIHGHSEQAYTYERGATAMLVVRDLWWKDKLTSPCPHYTSNNSSIRTCSACEICMTIIMKESQS